LAVSSGILSAERIRENVEKYGSGVLSTGRYASFDYCFNYFQSSRDEEFSGSLADSGHLEQSCLQLGFYLASWGMYRGSASLVSQSARGLAPTINAIAGADPRIWSVDVDGYDDESIQLVLDIARSIRAVIPGGNSDTLVTKVMLGVFGCVPAYDRFVRSGLGVRGLTGASLEKIRSIYETQSALIEEFQRPTLDFVTEKPTNLTYTKAKVIDMIYFIEGQRS
jgi:hypothetical protein